MNRITRYLALASITTLCLSAGSLIAQAQPTPGGGPGGPGGGGPGGGRGGRGGFDPAQMQERMMQGVRDQLEIKDDTEWKAIQPLVQKVMDLRRAQMGSGMRGAFGGGRTRGGNPPTDQAGPQTGTQDNRSRFGGESSAEETALNEAIDKGSSKDILKEKMAAYRKAKAGKDAELKAAQESLKKVLNTKQEAIALRMSLVN